MSSKTIFKKDWLQPNAHPKFGPWVEEIKGAPYKYRCYTCCHVYEVSNTGQQASHMKMLKKPEGPTAARETTSNLEDLWKPSMFLSCLSE